MTTLAEVLADPVRRAAVVTDAAALVDAEVASKRGLRGAAIKTGFRAFHKVQPNMMQRALNKLLPHFVPVIDPLWTEARQTPDPRGWFVQRDTQVADALLGVTDDLSKKAKNRVLVKIYSGLRGQAHAHVVAAVPGLADLIQKHTP